MGNENEIQSSIERKDPPVATGVSRINTSVRERLQSLHFSYNDLTQDALRKMILEEGWWMQILELLIQWSDWNLDNRELHELTLQVKRNERKSYREMLAILPRENPCHPWLSRAYKKIKVEIKKLKNKKIIHSDFLL